MELGVCAENYSLDTLMLSVRNVRRIEAIVIKLDLLPQSSNLIGGVPTHPVQISPAFLFTRVRFLIRVLVATAPVVAVWLDMTTTVPFVQFAPMNTFSKAVDASAAPDTLAITVPQRHSHS
jgi:hypothetical protein